MAESTAISIQKFDGSDYTSWSLEIEILCNGVVKHPWLGLPDGHVRCPVPGNRQPYIDIAMET